MIIKKEDFKKTLEARVDDFDTGYFIGVNNGDFVSDSLYERKEMMRGYCEGIKVYIHCLQGYVNEMKEYKREIEEKKEIKE